MPLAGHKIVFKLVRAGHPARAQCAFAAGLRINRQCPLGCAPKIGIQSAGEAIIDDIDWAGNRISGNRHTAGHRLKIYQPKRIREAREYHDIGCGQVCREILTESETHEVRGRVLVLEARPLGPITDDHF